MSHTAETMLEVPRLPKAAAAGPKLTWARQILLPGAVAVALIAIWQAAIVLTNFPRVIVPAPSDIALSILANRLLLLQHSWPTVATAVAGFLISTVLGAVLAVTGSCDSRKRRPPFLNPENQPATGWPD